MKEPMCSCNGTSLDHLCRVHGDHPSNISEKELAAQDILGFDSIKALKITRSRVNQLCTECADDKTKAGLDDLYSWLDAVISLVSP